MKNTNNLELTTLASWLNMPIRTLKAMNINHEPLLKKIGIDSTLISQPEKRLSIEQTSEFLAACVKATKTETFGLNMAENSQLPMLQNLGQAIGSSATFFDALKTIAEFAPYISSGVNVEFISNTQESCFNYSFVATHKAPHVSADWLAALITRLVRNYGEKSIYARSMSFCHSPSTAARKVYTDYFQCSIHYGWPQYSLCFDTQELQSPLFFSNPTIHEVSSAILKQKILDFRETDSVLSTATEFIYNNLSQGAPKIKDVAQHVCLSERSLQRRLKTANLTFSTLINDVRVCYVTELMKSPKRNLEEISSTLGFKNSSSFSRWFKKHFDQMPSEYPFDP